MTDSGNLDPHVSGEPGESDIAQYDQSETLDQGAVADPLDVGIAPPSYPPRWYGRPDEWDPGRAETIEDRIAQELPDVDAGRNSSADEPGPGGQRLGGDDPDGITADDDWLGDGQVGRLRTGRLVSPDEGAHGDDDDEMFARDEGVDGGAASAEEAAMHVIDDRSDEESAWL